MSKLEYLKSYGGGVEDESIDARAASKLQKYKKRPAKHQHTRVTSGCLSVSVDDDIPVAVPSAASRRAMRGAGIPGLDGDMALMNELEGSSDEERREEVAALWRGVAQGGDTISLDDEELLRGYLEQRKQSRKGVSSNDGDSSHSRARTLNGEMCAKQDVVLKQPQYDEDGDIIDIGFNRRPTKSKHINGTASSSTAGDCIEAVDGKSGAQDSDGYTNIKKRRRGMRSDEIDGVGVYSQDAAGYSNADATSSSSGALCDSGDHSYSNKVNTTNEHVGGKQIKSPAQADTEVDSDGDIIVRRHSAKTIVHDTGRRTRRGTAGSDSKEPHSAAVGDVPQDTARDEERSRLPPSMQFVMDTAQSGGTTTTAVSGGSNAGQAASVIYRDSDGNEISRDEWMDLQMKKDAARGGRRVRPPRLAEPQVLEWEGGIIQQQAKEAKEIEDARTAAAPVARFEIDANYDRQLRDQHYWDDPMREYLTGSPPAPAGDAAAQDEDSCKSKKAKCRFVTPINRFGITAGYRWDGVVRGTGYESRMMQVKNTRELEKEEEYKWTMEDI